MAYTILGLILSLITATLLVILTSWSKICGLYHRDIHLFYTHTPDYYQPGKLHDRSSHMITRLIEVAPTSTIYGGYVRCYEVRGRKFGG